MKLEVIVLPVTDVDRARDFYQQLGWRLDADFTAADYALITGVNLAGFLWLTQLAIAQMLRRGRGHVVNISATIADR